MKFKNIERVVNTDDECNMFGAAPAGCGCCVIISMTRNDDVKAWLKLPITEVPTIIEILAKAVAKELAEKQAAAGERGVH